MKALAIRATTLIIGLSVYGQGQFLFDTHDSDSGNIVVFTLNGNRATGPDLFVQVFAGPDTGHLAPLSPLLPLDRTGAEAGYTNPFSQVYQVPGLAGGTSAVIAYVGFKGPSLEEASARGLLNLGLSPVTLTESPTEPNRVALGIAIVPIDIPEPGTLCLELIGIGALFLAGWRSLTGAKM